ncbi:MAG TPA: TetR/AcrR family transcriptional regulator [Candidatus Limnocylindria bacterium]|nr:TetR/AcrR family transcriptional regulator [Candidatus Limnocylindria bacterium]
MTPRSYSQHRRATSSAKTKRRIRQAALDLYRERGITRTTISGIAERADVSRGTVLNHYGNAEQLLNHLLDEIVVELGYPDERVMEGAASEPERVRRYVDAMFRFFVRSEEHWPSFAGSLDHPVARAREEEFYSVVGRLYAATFLDLASDRVVEAAARAYVNYSPLNDLRAAGLTLDEAIEVVSNTLIDLVARRRGELAMPVAQ